MIEATFKLFYPDQAHADLRLATYGSYVKVSVYTKALGCCSDHSFDCRRQEIVFIGAGMDEDAITKQLDTALLTVAEMTKYVDNYKNKPDPPHPEL